MEAMVGAIFAQGKRSIKVPVPVYIRASASVAGTKEGEGPFGDCFDVVGHKHLTTHLHPIIFSRYDSMSH